MRPHGRARLAFAPAVVVALVAPFAIGLSGCAAIQQPVPTCGSVTRLALVAQSVPTAAYVPCLGALPTGWGAGGFQATSGHARFTLRSDLAPGRPVQVALRASCDVAGATSTTPRGPGVATYIWLRSIAPRYAGTLTDQFAGGCVTYQFDFQRGPHITLMEDFEAAVTLYPRQELAVQVHQRLGVTLGP